MSETSLADKAARRIRTLIDDKCLKPGAHVNIDALAKEFGVSQTPIREALKKLISEGLVVYRPQKGYSVRNLTLHEYLQVSEILEMVESHLIKELAKTPFLVDTAALRSINTEFETAIRLNDCGVIGRVNDRFHAKLYENYYNKLLLSRFSALWREVRTTRDIMYANKAFTDKIVAEHEAIISAVEAGDPEAAERAVSAHYVSGRESALKYFPVDA